MTGSPLRFGVVTLFPAMLRSVADHSIVGRAQRRGLLDVQVFDPRDHVGGRHRVVDDRPYGGGPGMVLAAPPVARCLDNAMAQLGTGTRLLMTSPQGRRLDQAYANELAACGRICVLCGHYEGIDERIVDLYQPEEFSVGDYVLSGGELPALTLLDAVTRLLPGVLGTADSAVADSFTEAELDHPCYTKPREFRGLTVPDVLCSGDHAKIAAWRAEQRQQRTYDRRPDLLEDA